MRMRIFLIVLSALALIGCGPETWVDQHGKRIEQQSVTSRWLIINYWAEWCGPCRDELPELNALSVERPDIAVVGINFDGLTGEQLLEVSEMMNIRFPVLDDEFAVALGVGKPSVLPTTYIVAPGGKPSIALQGPQSAESLLAVIEQAQAQP